MSLPPVSVVIKASYAGLTAAVQGAVRQVDGLSQRLGGSASRIREGFNSAMGPITRFAAPVLAAAAAVGTFAAVLDSINRAETLKKQSEQLGVTTKQLQELQFAAKLNASSAEAMSAALLRMNRSLASLHGTSSEAGRAVRALGINIADFAKLDNAQKFAAISDGLRNVSSASERASRSFQIFGRQGADVAGVLALGSEGLAQFSKEAEEAGAVVSDVDLAKLAVAGDAVDKLKAAFSGMQDRLAAAFGPAIEYLAGVFTRLSASISGSSSLATGLLKAIAIAIGVVKMAWDGLRVVIGVVGIRVASLSVAIFETARGATRAAMWIGEKFSQAFTLVKAVGKLVFIDTFSWIFGELKNFAIQAFASITTTVLGGLQPVADALELLGATDLSAAITEQLKTATAATKELSDESSSAIETSRHKIKESLTDVGLAAEALFDAGNVDTTTEKLDKLALSARTFLKGTVDFTAEAAEAVRNGGGFSRIGAELEAADAAARKFAASVASQLLSGLDSASGAAYQAVTVAAGGIREILYVSTEAVKAIGEELLELESAYVDKSFSAIKKAQHDREMVYANTKLINIQAMAEQDAAHAKFTAMAAARAHAYTQSLAQGMQASQEKVFQIRANESALNAKIIGEQEAALVEWQATRVSRESNFFIEMIKKREEHAETMRSMDLIDGEERTGAEEDLLTRISEKRLQFWQQDQDLQKENLALWASGAEGKLQVMGEFFSQMSALSESKNRQMFEVGKAASIANTAISTYEGAQKAYTSLAQIPVVGHALGVAAAGAAIVAGMARIQAIRSTRIGGGAGGGASSSGSARGSGSGGSQSGQSSEPRRAVSVTLMGSNFDQSQVRGLITSINEALGDNMSLKVQGG